MKILLIGGTGVISTDISALAVKKGMELYLINRGNRSMFAPKEAICIQADIRDAMEAKKKTEGMHFDVVVDFISFTPEQLMQSISLFRDKCSQYIFISSATVYSREDQKTPIREDSTPLTNVLWDYSRNKVACEMLLKKENDLYGLNYTIVRPYVTYGNTRIPFALISGAQWTLVDRMLKGKPILMANDGNAVCTLTRSSDFAKGFLPLCGNPKAYCESYHITSDETFTWNDVARMIGEAIGVEPKLVYLPIPDIARGMPTTAYGDVYSLLTADKATNWYFDNSKIKQVAPEFICTTPFSQGLRETIDFYCSHPEYKKVDQLWNEQIDRLIGEHW